MSAQDDNTHSAVATREEAVAAESSERPCIVLATNGSPEADEALHFAAALASREELLLRVLTVLEPLPTIPAQPAGLGWYATVETTCAERVLDGVRRELSRLNLAPSAVTCTVVGTPGTAIATTAREWNARYVIVGSGKHGAVERLLTGDTVIRILRHSASPVIAIPASGGGLPRNGVVAVDFGRASLAAAHSAAEVIGSGVLHILHIRPELDFPATDPSAWSEVYESGAQSLMTKLAAELQASYTEVHTTTRVLRGHVATVLLDYAEHVGADLIAVGQHGHGVVDRFLLGTVAHAVVHAAHCAVLVAPPVDQ